MAALFDAHLHLSDIRLKPIRATFEAAAQAAHIDACLSCAAFPKEWSHDILSSRRVFRAYGAHPWCADRITAPDLSRLEETLRHAPDSLVGEVGLDGLRPTQDGGAAQRTLFQAQLALAATLERPLVVHGARAWNAVFQQLSDFGVHRLPGILLHGAAFSKEILRLPLFRQENIRFSIGCALLNPQARTVHELAKVLPLDRLVIETDAPDMTPRGGTSFPGINGSNPLNHPDNLHTVAMTLSHLRGIPFSEIAAQTYQNALHFCMGTHA